MRSVSLASSLLLLLVIGCHSTSTIDRPSVGSPQRSEEVRPSAEEILQRIRDRSDAAEREPAAPSAATTTLSLPLTEPAAAEVMRFGDSEVAHWDSEALPSFVDPAAYCQEQANLRLEQERSGERASVVEAQPACRPVALPFTFAPDRTFLSLRALEVFDGSAKRTTLLVETKRGFTALPVEWNVESPEPSECPGATVEIGVELARVDSGVLAVASLVERTAYENFSFDLPSPTGLTRRVTVVRVFDDGVFARTYDPLEALGWKAQPARAWAAWQHLPWFGRRAFVVDATGVLTIR